MWTMPVCVLPGCEVPVGTWGDACDGCREAFGSMLQTTGAPLGQEDIKERDAEVAHAYQQQKWLKGRTA